MEGDKRYADLASEIRQFVGRIAGPSLDLLGPSLELLCYEGLAAASDGEGMEDNARLAVTEEGRRVFARLMTSNVRAPVNDLGKLVIALKMRFLHRSEEHTSELQSLMRISYADFCLKKKIVHM